MTAPLSFSACSTSLPPRIGAAFRIIPAGLFRSDDGSGRPAGIPGWKLTAARAAAIIAAVSARADDLLIDYEHQSMSTSASGKPAPAAGWFKRLEWREDGLYVTDARWTAAAAQMIEAQQYRFVSPVFGWDKQSGEVVSLVSIGLTNTPALQGLTDLGRAEEVARQEAALASYYENDALAKLRWAFGQRDAAPALPVSRPEPLLRLKSAYSAVGVLFEFGRDQDS